MTFNAAGLFEVVPKVSYALKMAFSGEGSFAAGMVLPFKIDFSGGGAMVADTRLPVGLAADFSGEGAFALEFRDAVNIAAEFSGGGQFEGAIRPIVTLEADFAAEASLGVALQMTHHLSASFDGGGALLAHLYPPHRLSMGFGAGGAMDAKIYALQALKAGFAGEGAMSVNAKIVPPVLLEMSFDGEGAMAVDVEEPLRPSVELAAQFDGGGAMRAYIFNLDDSVSAIIAAMVPAPSSARQGEIRALVEELYEAGIWDQIVGLYLLHAHSEQASRINWKSPGTFDLTAHGTVNFTPNDGTESGASPSGLLTNYVPSTGERLTASDSMLMVFTEDLALYEGTFDAGVVSTIRHFTTGANVNSDGSTGFRSRPATATQVNSEAGVLPGLYGFSKTGVGAGHIVKSTATIPFTGLADSNLPEGQIVFGGYRTDDVVAIPSPRKLKAGIFGRSITQTQSLQLNIALGRYTGIDVLPPSMDNTEAEAIVAAMTLPPPNYRAAAIDAFITATKEAGVWDKLDCLYMLHAHDIQAAHLNWKSPGNFTLVPTGSRTDALAFVPDNSYTGAYFGSSSGAYLDSGWVAAEHAEQYTLNNAGIYVYSDTTSQLQPSTVAAIGSYHSPSATRAMFNPRQNLGGGYGAINTAARFGSSFDADYLPALRGIIRTSATQTSLFHKGTEGAVSSEAAVGLPQASFGVCGMKNLNSSLTDTQLGYASPIIFGAWGAALTPTEMVALDAAITTFRSTTA